MAIERSPLQFGILSAAECAGTALPSEPGIYLLTIPVDRHVEIRIGALGVIHFDPGLYIYVGSAMGGLRGRVMRHLRSDKKIHWHIDYLLERFPVKSVGLVTGSNIDTSMECRLAAYVSASGESEEIVGFGSSDCDCVTHLFWAGRGVSNHILKNILKEFCKRQHIR